MLLGYSGLLSHKSGMLALSLVGNLIHGRIIRLVLGMSRVWWRSIPLRLAWWRSVLAITGVSLVPVMIVEHRFVYHLQWLEEVTLIILVLC